MASLTHLQVEISKAVYERGFDDAKHALISELKLLIADGLEYECPVSEIIKHIEEVKPNLKGKDYVIKCG